MASLESATGQLSVVKTIFKWQINVRDFSEKKIGESLASSEFHAGNLRWRLLLYPSGIRESTKNFVAIFLKLRSNVEEGVEANVSFSICHDTIEDYLSKPYFNQILWPNKGKGTKQFIEIKKLIDDRYWKIHNNNLNIICKISTITNSHCEKLITFEKLFNSEKFSDVKLILGDKHFYAHKNILANASPVFEAMFEHNMKENTENVVEINDIAYNVLYEMLRFVYIGAVNDIKNIALPLMVAADKYDIVDLKTLCTECLCNSLSLTNAVEYLSVANQHNVSVLENLAIDFIVSNAKDMIDLPEFDAIPNLETTVVLKLLRGLTLKSVTKIERKHKIEKE